MTLNFTAGRSLQLASITDILWKRGLSSDGFERGDEFCDEPCVLRSFAERGETGELNHLLAYSFPLPLSFHSTHIQVVSFDNRPFARTSCGTEGFQNAKKGTAIAAQTAGIAAATVSLCWVLSPSQRGDPDCIPCYLGTGEWRTSTVTSVIFGGKQGCLFTLLIPCSWAALQTSPPLHSSSTLFADSFPSFIWHSEHLHTDIMCLKQQWEMPRGWS